MWNAYKKPLSLGSLVSCSVWLAETSETSFQWYGIEAGGQWFSNRRIEEGDSKESLSVSNGIGRDSALRSASCQTIRSLGKPQCLLLGVGLQWWLGGKKVPRPSEQMNQTEGEESSMKQDRMCSCWCCVALRKQYPQTLFSSERAGLVAPLFPRTQVLWQSDSEGSSQWPVRRMHPGDKMHEKTQEL